MKIKFVLFCMLSGLFMSCTAPEGIEIKKKAEGFCLYVDGTPTYIKGIGGNHRLDIAARSGANAFRTWGGDIETVAKALQDAAAHGMWVMQGIDMTKDSARYHDEVYKNEKREEVRRLAETFKNDKSLLAWGIGNEIDLGNANIEAAWNFVEELAQLIKSIDKRHLVSTVISYKASALNMIARYAPSLDYVGINVYGPMQEVRATVDHSDYKGPIMITEWGPTGWWETTYTEWKAPIEQTSEEKRQVYEERYSQYIASNPRCLGSFVFLWGQKEERTPTWFSMFVENGVDGLPLKGEKTPMVEAMQRVWNKQEPEQTAPVVQTLTVNGQHSSASVRVSKGSTFEGEVKAADKESSKLTYVWEILKEATVLGFGGSYEPRPERVGTVLTTDTQKCQFAINTPGNYRLYVYVLDDDGFVSTVNQPFQVVE